MAHLLSFEWRLLARERTLWLLLLVLGGLGAYASVSGGSHARERVRAIAELRQEEASRIDSLSTLAARLERGEIGGVPAFRDPRVPAIAGRGLAGRYAILDPGPLAALAVGQSDVQPFWTLVSTRTKQTFFVNEEIENPVHLLAGRLDLAFLVLVIYPLLILALTFDVVSGERERGTLALLLSQPVDPRRVLTAKVGLRALIALGLTLALSLGAAAATGVEFSSGAALLRLALWSAVVLLYGAFWFAVALYVNARRLGSAASAVALLGVWLAVVVVLPAIAAAAVSVTHPAPSRLTLTAQLREATDAAAARRQDAVASFLLDHPGYVDGAETADPYVVATALQDAAERTMAPAYIAFDEALDAQRHAADRFRLLSPALVVQAALLDLAGSGESRFRSFERQFDAYHAEWRQYFNDRMLARQRLTAAEVASVPTFTFVEEPLAALMLRLAPGLLLMLVLTVGIAVSARRGLRIAARSA